MILLHRGGGVRHFVLLSFFMSIPVGAETFRYQSSGLVYELQYQNGVLDYRSRDRIHRFAARDCSKELIQKFWKRVREPAGTLPRLNTSKEKTYAQLDKKKLKVSLLRRAEFSRIPNRVSVLVMREARLCSK